MISAIHAAALSLVCLFVRALAVAADAGFAATSSEALEERGASPSRLEAFVRLKTRPETLYPVLRTVLASSLAFAAASAALAGAIWARGAAPAGRSLLVEVLGALGAAVAVSLLTTTLDLGARAFAAADPAGTALRAMPVVVLLTRVFGVPLRLLARLVDLFMRPFGLSARFGPPRPPLEDLERLLQEEARQGEFDPESPDMIRNIFEMSEMTAREVMVPRTSMVALDIQTPTEEILRVLAERGHSRMPIFDGEIDNVIGVLHVRDLIPMMQNPELIVVQDIIRPPHFIPWSKPVNDILREMQKKHIHMALVIDEYGGLMGVITLEDVLEVIVGDIQDEYDEDVPEIEPTSDCASLVRASVSRDDFNAAFSVELPEGEFETLGGFLNSLAGCIPEVGDKFFFGGLQLTVQVRTPKRVKRVRVQRVAGSAADVACQPDEAASA